MEKLGSVDGRAEYTMLIENQKVGLAELLAMFPSCVPPLDSVLNVMPALMPRYYSVASSPIEDPFVISIAFTVLEYEINVAKYGNNLSWRRSDGQTGGCHGNLETKGFMHNMVGEIGIAVFTDAGPNSIKPPEINNNIFIREAKEFVLPANTKWPLIFVGPGTGVAPFVGFLLQRAALKENEAEKDDVCSGYWRLGFEIEDEIKDDVNENSEVEDLEYGPIHLFFGNRNRDQDFLYEKKLKMLIEDGILSSLHTAFSRDQVEKVYVQHKMKKNGEMIAKALLKENGYFYVCGDGAKMAIDVERALLDIIVAHGSKYFEPSAIGSLQLIESVAGDKFGAKKEQNELNGFYDEDGNLTVQTAQRIIQAMKERQRLVKDVWS